jgi:hypothetical protein
MSAIFNGNVRTLTNTYALDVALVDANGDQLTTPFDVNVANTPLDVNITASYPASSTLTSVPVATTSITLAAANANRRQLLLFNDGSNVVYIAFAATATSTAFSVRIAANGFYETPLNGYTGIVTAIRTSGSGAVRVTEVTV